MVIENKSLKNEISFFFDDFLILERHHLFSLDYEREDDLQHLHEPIEVEEEK